MKAGRNSTAIVCFAGLLAVGCALLFVGLALEPVMPIVTLDRVLTPRELMDPEKRERALAFLERAQGNRWLFWTLAGAIVVMLSGAGLWATLRQAAGGDNCAQRT